MISSIFKSTGVGATVQTAELDDDSVTSDKIANTIAVATPAILPVPTVPANAVVNALKPLISPLFFLCNKY